MSRRKPGKKVKKMRILLRTEIPTLLLCPFQGSLRLSVLHLVLGRLSSKRINTQNFLKVIVHVIIIDQLNQTACLYEIQVTVIYSQAILGAMASECHKEGNL